MMINQLADANLEDIYFDKGFIILIESFLPSLRNGTINYVDVVDALNYKHVGDLYGLLTHYNVSKKYHHIVSKFNGFNNSNDYNGELSRIALPDFNFIEQLKNIYLTKNN